MADTVSAALKPIAVGGGAAIVSWLGGMSDGVLIAIIGSTGALAGAIISIIPAMRKIANDQTVALFEAENSLIGSLQNQIDRLVLINSELERKLAECCAKKQELAGKIYGRRDTDTFKVTNDPIDQ